MRFVFCLVISAAVWVFARPLMLLFVDANESAIIAEGVRYLHIEGAFYCGIGCLFLLYGLYRALGRPGMSVVLTGGFSWHKGDFGVCTFRGPRHRCRGNLVVGSHRLVPGRRRRGGLLSH